MCKYLMEDEIIGIHSMTDVYKTIYYEMSKSRSLLNPDIYDLGFPTQWEQIQKGEIMLFVIELKATGNVCGFCQFAMYDPKHPEFGIDILDQYKGKSYGKRAIKLLYTLARKWDSVEYFVWKAEVGNIASQKIAKSIGAVLMQETTLFPQLLIDLMQENGFIEDENEITMVREYKIEK